MICIKCDDNYEKIKKRLEEENRNIKYRYIQGPTGPKGEKGDTGISESIVVEETQTLPSTESAEVIDNLENNTHHLTFCIPKGQNGSAGATASNAVLFVNYQDATVAKSLTIRQKIFIPSSTTLFTIPNTLDINVNTTGIYELTLCGKVSGVNNTNGAKFYLLNTVTGDILNNLAFELKAGNTSDMDFCGTIITEIFAPATFQLKSVIVNDSGTSNINFSDINLIMKRYNT